MKHAFAIALVVALFGVQSAGNGHDASAAAPQQGTQAAGVYRIRLGSFEITVLSDGTHPFPDAAILTKPIPGTATRALLFRSDPNEADTLLKEADLTPPTEGSINAFLINTGHRLILIDSGAGTLYGSCCGHLLTNLKAAGYRPDQIDEIFLTHLHEDHVGGIAPKGRMAFPNAVVRASLADANYWLNARHERAAPAFLHAQFEGARISLRPYIQAGRFKTFSGATELYPGIRALPAPGHTPGHTFYEVTSNGKKLLIWCDVVHVAALQFPDPSITTEYDTNPAQAEQTRRRVFEEASRSEVLVGAMHVSFPGLGHVAKRAKSYAWIPVEYFRPSFAMNVRRRPPNRSLLRDPPATRLPVLCEQRKPRRAQFQVRLNIARSCDRLHPVAGRSRHVRSYEGWHADCIGPFRKACTSLRSRR